MTRAYIDYLHDILDVSAKAQKFVEHVDFASFEANEEKVYAVIRALEIIGEAVKFIPQTERDRYPQIPWSAVVMEISGGDACETWFKSLSPSVLAL